MPGSMDSSADFSGQVAHDISATMQALGLTHVPVIISSAYAGEEVVEHLKQLYEQVGPAGVALVVTACLGDVAGFMVKHTTIFREKTQVVIHMGGALIAPVADTTSPCGETRDLLGPDPLAKNNNMDMPAAVRFYQIAQDS